MSDRISKEQRSINMKAIKGKDTKQEVLVRKYLFSKGKRFRKNDRKLPGTPDVVLPKYKTVIFINGCFWHRHENCKLAYIPKSNVEFWNKKFKKNIRNDLTNKEKLKRLDFRIIEIWECELKNNQERVLEELNKKLDNFLKDKE